MPLYDAFDSDPSDNDRILWQSAHGPYAVPPPGLIAGPKEVGQGSSGGP